MNVKEWFQKGTGLLIERVKYRSTPTYPYQIYTDKMEYYGPDSKRKLVRHSIMIERFSQVINNSDEELIETFLTNQNLSFIKYWQWLDKEECIKTTYEIEQITQKK